YYTLNYAGFTPYLVKAVQEIASISDTFQQNLIAWLGNAGNGITDLYATVVHAHQVMADELCVGATCVTPAQFQAMVAAANQSASAGSSSTTNTDTTSSTPDTPPVIQIN